MSQRTSSHSMPDTQRVQYVARNYQDLQGLRYAPLGLFLLLWGTLRWLEAPTWLTDSPLPFLLVLLLGIPSYKIIGGYYEHRFGRVEPDSERTRRERRWSFVAPFVVLSAIVLDEVLQLPKVMGWLIWMTPVLVSMFLFDWPNRRFTIHRIIAVLLFLGLSLLPLLGITEWNIYTLFLITIGLMLFIIGILDHLLLVHTLKPVPEEDDGTDF